MSFPHPPQSVQEEVLHSIDLFGRMPPVRTSGTGFRRAQAFTLLEILVVIAILAILAAFLFPIFSSAKSAATQSDSVSNLNQIQLATSMYMQDHDDTTPFFFGTASETIAARLLAYSHDRDIFRIKRSTHKQGAWNYAQGCGLDPSCQVGNLMQEPQSDCAGGLPKSAEGRQNLYSDVYPALDFQWNDSLSNSYPLPQISCTPYGSYVSKKAVYNGLSGGSSLITNPAKVGVWMSFPSTGTQYPGGCVDLVCDGPSKTNFWGDNFKGLFHETSSLVFLDGHAASEPFSKVHPCGLDRCEGINSTDPHLYEQGWKGWGLSFASPSVQ